ncbi:MAG: MFS transporter permease [Hyphomicrobiales bacterium]|nr:MAG: MFS transporter permease [Hyphomicrobiales bacterium]
MDFMRLLKLIEELLYELVSWVIFYPLTLWRIVRHPMATLAYAERELGEPEEHQFDDAISPPIVLLITLGLLHVLGQAMATESTAVMTGVLADDRNLLAFRAVAFSLFPLLFGLIRLKVAKARITRSTFKPVFYSQCYATVPFVITISMGINLLAEFAESAIDGWIGVGVLCLGFVWYVTVESRWLAATTRTGMGRSVLTVIGTLICAVPFFFLVGAIVGYVFSEGAMS